MQVYCSLHNILIPAWTWSYLDPFPYPADYYSARSETTETDLPCKLILQLLHIKLSTFVCL